jgi:hypothetical protein
MASKVNLKNVNWSQKKVIEDLMKKSSKLIFIFIRFVSARLAIPSWKTLETKTEQPSTKVTKTQETKTTQTKQTKFT